MEVYVYLETHFAKTEIDLDVPLKKNLLRLEINQIT